MKYFKIVCETPYSGTDMEVYKTAEKEEDLHNEAEQLNLQNAESYEYLVTGWDDDEFDNEDDRQEALGNYYADCNWYIEEVTKEEYEENT